VEDLGAEMLRRGAGELAAKLAEGAFTAQQLHCSNRLASGHPSRFAKDPYNKDTLRPRACGAMCSEMAK
jgi:hypothetical protein